VDGHQHAAAEVGRARDRRVEFGDPEVDGPGRGAAGLRRRHHGDHVARDRLLVGATGPDRDTGTVPGSVGRVTAGTELRVVAGGRDLGPGEDGELWVRGPQNTPGYRGRPEATAELIDADGWVHTGDLGHVDRDGNVWIVDRLKELIKVGGMQVAPAELEALLVQHPAIADAAVVPRPDPSRGEVPVAFVVARGQVDVDAVREWVNGRVAPYKRIRELHVVDALPRTPSGKLLRRRVREPLAA
jgi:acyl-CoA synthetase (AMP-forming)/AMP-acid ligase II